MSEGQCGMACAGSRGWEKCGDRDRMSVYRMTTGGYVGDSSDDDHRYLGCYGDSRAGRAMSDAGKYVDSRHMTNSVSGAQVARIGSRDVSSITALVLTETRVGSTKRSQGYRSSLTST